MYKNKWIVLGTWALFLPILVLAGCSTSTDTTTTTAAATTTTTAATTTTTTVLTQAVISGSLSLSGVGAAATGVKSFAAAESYVVVAQNTDTGELSFATTDSAGDFEITVSTSESWSLNVIGSDAEYTGPIVIATLEGDQAAMAVDTSANVALGSIVIDSSTGSIAPTAEVDSNLVSTTEVARVDEHDVPVGVGNAGKGTAADYNGTLTSGFDADKDGLPNFLDADNDGDGTIDELDTGSGLLTEAVVGLDAVDAIDLSSQLSLSYNQTSSYDPAQNSSLFIAVNPSSSVVENVVSLEVTSVSTRYANATLIPPSGTSQTYPDEGTSWANTGYQLFKVIEGETVRYIAWINPLTHPQAGDVFVFRMTYNDDAYDEFSKMINYSFSSVASLQAYSVGTSEMITAPAANDSSNPIVLTGTTEVTLRVNRPTDENSETISGFTYSLTLFTYSDTSFEASVASSFPEVEVDDDGVGAVDIGYTFPSSVGTTEVVAYKVDIDCKSSPGGDQATQYLYLVRE